MKKTMIKMMLGASVLTGVAVVSYQAGAAKAKPSITMSATEIKWEPLMGGPLQIAKLWGDRDKGPEWGALLKFPAGLEAGMHAHTADYHGLSIVGTWVHTVDGEAGPGKELGPGSYVFQPGKQMHNDVCKGKSECIVYVHQHGKGDFIPAKKPAGADKAPAAAPAAPAPAAPPAAAPTPAAPAAPAKK
jgi:hypothetical protein